MTAVRRWSFWALTLLVAVVVLVLWSLIRPAVIAVVVAMVVAGGLVGAYK